MQLTPGARGRWVQRGAIALILAAGIAAYANSFSGTFVFDDFGSVVDNPSIRRLGSLAWLHPPGYGATVEARPFLNLTFAVNHAISGDDVWGYHFGNLIIHLAAAVTVFGLVRRSALRRRRAGAGAAGIPDEPGPIPAAGFALAVALIWELHPLQTESVTYMAQRAESLAGLLQLLALYGFVRADEVRETESRRWQVLSVGACLIGMAAKETTITAPVIVLAYDAVFSAGSAAAALRRRPLYYGALAACWIPLALLVLHGTRKVVFGPHGGVALGQYWLTQPAAIVHYLRLTFWPHPLVLDYGALWVSSVRAVVGPASLVLLLGTATVLAWLRGKRTHGTAWSVCGFLGFCFFGWLALTSLVPGPRQTLAEHRMYLALLPVVLLACWGMALVLSRFRRGRAIGLAAALIAAGLGGWATWQRNKDYTWELTLFAHDAAVQPDNPQALANYGLACEQTGDWHRAEAALQQSLRLRPNSPKAEFDLGSVEAHFGRWAEAEQHLRHAIAAEPDNAYMRIGLFEFLLVKGRRDQAMKELGPWITQHEEGRRAFDHEARTACVRGRADMAVAFGQALVELFPQDAELRNHLGISEAAAGDWSGALACYRRAIQLDPGNAGIQFNLGTACLQTHQLAEAEQSYRRALRLQPNYPKAHCNLGEALRLQGRRQEAEAEYRAAARIDPADPLPPERLRELQSGPAAAGSSAGSVPALGAQSLRPPALR